MLATAICPLLSSGSDIDKVCLKEDCAWFVKSYKTCSVYLLAHNAALDIKEKQAKINNKTSQS